MKKVIIDGNTAVSQSAYLFTELASIYPITPSSTMAEVVEVMASKGVKNLFNSVVKVVEMQSEAGAAGVMHGALQAGVLANTFTASQGLLLMIPNMYKIAGEMLPCVIHVAARSLSTHALSILGDHQDVYAVRGTGFNMLAASSVEEASDMALVAHLAAIKSQLPFVHFFDGFRTSHELAKVNVLEISDIKDLVNMEDINKFKANSLLNKTYTVGTNQNDDIYFQVSEARNIFYNKVPDIVNDIMQQINKIKGTNYKPFEYYGSSIAENIIVAMGSVNETIKETIDYLNNNGYQVGLIIVHLYRPFSSKYLKEIIPVTVKKIAVLDRAKESGSSGEALYLDVRSVCSNYLVYGGRYGLSGKNTNPACIKAIYDFLNNKPYHNFTVGINDDVTNLSIPVDYSFTIKNSCELLIYGYGSDGSVSASKSLLTIIGNNSSNYVQGYFQYDSKKSGGVTISHLRISKKPIKSTYYVENPKYVVITKDTYLNDFECLDNIAENGIVLINTTKTDIEINRLLTNKDTEILINRHIKVFSINAYLIALKLGLGNKISMIMESAIMNIMDDVDYVACKNDLITYIKSKFSKAGVEIVNANINSLDEAVINLKEVVIMNEFDSELLDINNKDLLHIISKRKGNNLSTGDVSSIANGRFYLDNKEESQGSISAIVPKWISSNCINCNQCSFVCPHSVIRPFLLSREEYEQAPDYVKEVACQTSVPNKEGYYYILAIAINKCTGCGLCVKSCPTLKKALEFASIDDMTKKKEMQIFDYLTANISSKAGQNKYSVKGSQFEKPMFEFCGACSGCGETAYIKLLTQLFGKQLVIANATGCSSIYGASTPYLPYKVSWASSLFEDNAEFGYGIVLANTMKQTKMHTLLTEHIDEEPILFKKWLDNSNDIDITKEVYDSLANKTLNPDLEVSKEALLTKSIWCIGGDGWAYDIGYGGIDHVLASGDNINILVLDTEVYSNTGGQSSKSSPKATIATFTSMGKVVAKKDLAAIAMMYPHTYVATISIGANKEQVIRVMKDAASYNGPSLIIAYAPCISHGITGGMSNSLESEKLAVKCGYFPLFHRDPRTNTFKLDFKNVDFNLYNQYLDSQLRYRLLKTVNKEKAESLLNSNKEDAITRFNYYKQLEEKII